MKSASVGGAVTAGRAGAVAATAAAFSVGFGWTRGVTAAGEGATTGAFTTGFNASTLTPEETCCGGFADVRGLGVFSSFLIF